MDNKYVFISYKSDDFEQALTLKKHLESNGIDCWMAPMSIRGGMSYAQEIPDAILNCSAFVLFLTAKAQKSKWIPRELDKAINCEKIIMPFMPENCTLRKDFGFYLSNVQRYEAFRNPQEALHRMTCDIQRLLGVSPISGDFSKNPEREKVPSPKSSESFVQNAPVNSAKPVQRPSGGFVQKVPSTPVQKKRKPTSKPRNNRVAQSEKKKSGIGSKILWALLGVVMVFSLICDLMLPDNISIAGEKFLSDWPSIELENATITQKDINKLDKFDDLRFITLHNCTVEAQDLSPLSAENLIELDLTGCNITDEQFSTIDFTSTNFFKKLYVGGNPELTDISSIKTCADALTDLDISNTGIKAFYDHSNESTTKIYEGYDWLSDFSGLKIFKADNMDFKDTSALEKLIYLEELSLSGNGITSLEGLKNTSKLSVVNLSNNSLTDVSVLSRSSDCLTELHLENNSLTDLEHLSDAYMLKKVYIDGNRLTSLDWLKGKKELQVLSAAFNRIESISDLGIGIRIHYLNLSNNYLETIEDGDLVFKDSDIILNQYYPIVNLCDNNIKKLQLPENCTYKLLSLTGNPSLELSSLENINGWNIYFDFPADVSLQTLKNISFNKVCIINCPLNRQVEIEEGLNNEQLMSKADALIEIAKTEAYYVNE